MGFGVPAGNGLVAACYVPDLVGFEMRALVGPHRQQRAPPKVNIGTRARTIGLRSHGVRPELAVLQFAGVGSSGPRPERQPEDARSVVRLGGQVQKVVRSAATAKDVMRRVNRLLVGRGIKIVSIRFASRHLVRRYSAEPLARSEARRATKTWRRLDDRTVEVSLRRHGRVLGSLVVVSPHLTPTREATVHIVAEGIAVAAHDVLVADVQKRSSEWQAHLAAQQRILLSARAHQRETLQNIRAVAQRYERADGAGTPGREIARSVDILELHLEWAEVAAELVPFGARTLQSSLRRLARWVGAHSQARLLVEVRGRPRPLPANIARAMYEVANESLRISNGLRSCTRIRVALRFEYGVLLTVTSDGLGTSAIDDVRATLERLLAPVGGTIEVQLRRTGMVIRASAPDA